MVITWRELLLLVLVVLAVYVAEMLLLMRGNRSGRRIWQRGALVSSQQRELDRLHDEIDDLRDEVGRLRALVEGKEPDQPVEMLVASGSPYTRAIELARAGAEVAEVAAQCGLTRGEAELIVTMHGAERT